VGIIIDLVGAHIPWCLQAAVPEVLWGKKTRSRACSAGLGCVGSRALKVVMCAEEESSTSGRDKKVSCCKKISAGCGFY